MSEVAFKNKNYQKVYRSKTYTAKTKELVKEMTREGYSTQEIMDELGIGKTAVNTIRRRMKI